MGCARSVGVSGDASPAQATVKLPALRIGGRGLGRNKVESPPEPAHTGENLLAQSPYQTGSHWVEPGPHLFHGDLPAGWIEVISFGNLNSLVTCLAVSRGFASAALGRIVNVELKEGQVRRKAACRALDVFRVGAGSELPVWWVARVAKLVSEFLARNPHVFVGWTALSVLTMARASGLPVRELPSAVLVRQIGQFEVDFVSGRWDLPTSSTPKPRPGDEARSFKLQVLAQFLSDPDVATRRQALQTLGRHGYPAGLHAPAMARFLRDPDQATRRQAVEALSSVAHVYMADVLCFLEDPDPEMRCEALWALGRMSPGEPEHGSAVAELLADPEPTVRQQAVRVLAGWGEAVAVHFPAMARLLDDPDKDVVIDTLKKLARLQLVADNVGSILRLTESPDRDIRIEARQVLAARRLLPPTTARNNQGNQEDDSDGPGDGHPSQDQVAPHRQGMAPLGQGLGGNGQGTAAPGQGTAGRGRGQGAAGRGRGQVVAGRGQMMEGLVGDPDVGGQDDQETWVLEELEPAAEDLWGAP